jgi:hypothetical protein
MNDKIYEMDKTDTQISGKTPMILLGLSIEAISNGGLGAQQSSEKSNSALSSCLDSLRYLLMPFVIPPVDLKKVLFSFLAKQDLFLIRI